MNKTVNTEEDNDTTFERLFYNKKSRDLNAKIHYRCGSGDNILLKSVVPPNYDRQQPTS